MEFVYPNFLWALALLSIPILVHLFYFRRYKKVYFTNVRFLKSVQEEQSTWRKIRNLLVLLARMLALAFLVFAFAQPFLPKEGVQKGNRAVSIYVDNSFSMNALSEEVNLLDEAKRAAIQIVESQEPSTQFQIIDNSLQANSRKWYNLEEALNRIDQIELRPEVHLISKIQRFQDNSFDRVEADQHLSFLISDFQKTTTDFASPADSSLQVYLLPLEAVQSSNISLDSVWFNTPIQTEGQSVKLYIKLTNHSDERIDEVDVSLREEKQTRPLKRLSLPAGATTIDTINYTPFGKGWQSATISVSDYPVQFDDRYQFAFNVPSEIRILTIYQSTMDPYLDAALNGIDIINEDKVSVNQVNYAALGTYNAIILQDIQSISSGLATALKQYTLEGGNVLVFPSSEADIPSYNAFLKSLGSAQLQQAIKQEAEVFSVEEEAFLFDGVFERQDQRLQLPKTSIFFPEGQAGLAGTETLMRFRQGTPFLSQYTAGNGSLLLCYAPLARSHSNLSASGELFVPIIFRTALLNREQDKIAFTIGRQSSFTVRKKIGLGEAGYRIEGEKSFIPYQRSLGSKVAIDLKEEIEKEGIYRLKAQDSTVRLLAFNYDRRESDLSCFSVAELEERVPVGMRILNLPKGGASSDEINKVVSGLELWKWCIILSIVFLMVEQLILRLWKME